MLWVRGGSKPPPPENSGSHPAPGWGRPETPTWRGRWGGGEDEASMGTHGALGIPKIKERRAIPMSLAIGPDLPD